MAAVHDDILDVLVVGGGWSGLLACKYAKEHNLTVRVLEKRDKIGGVWCYTEDVSTPTVMKTTSCSSSSSVTEMSDFPMPEEIGEFPKHEDVFDYLLDYYEHFQLERHIIFNCSVNRAEKSGTIWNVETESGVLYRSRNLAVCTGE